MFLEEIVVVQNSVNNDSKRSALRHYMSAQTSFSVQTCLRDLWLFTLEPGQIFEDHFVEARSGQVYRGVAAYSYLLSVSCGLESLVKGETEIFSQVKTAWKALNSGNSDFAVALRPWMQKLFTDCKEIRSEFLQGIGGASYASLARKLMSPEPEDRILVIGAGELGQAVAPLFTKYKLCLWNRDKKKLGNLLKKLVQSSAHHVVAVGDDELHEYIGYADHVVICTPMGIDDEQKWVEARAQSEQPGRTIHLGGKKANAGHWNKVDLLTLTDIFALQEDQNQIKNEKVMQAKEACHIKAKHRHLMDAISMNHGWEDLTGLM